MRLHSDRDKKNEHPKELIEIGRELLSSAEFEDRDNMRDHRLTQIANASLSGPDGVRAAKALCEKLREALVSHKVSVFEFDDLISSLFRLQPQAALDAMFDKDPEWHFGDFDDESDRKKKPLDGVDPDFLIKWCEVSPSTRYERIAQAVNFRKQYEKGEEWSPVAIALLKNASDPKAILETFIERFHPRVGWDRLRKRSRLGCHCPIKSPIYLAQRLRRWQRARSKSFVKPSLGNVITKTIETRIATNVLKIDAH